MEPPRSEVLDQLVDLEQNPEVKLHYLLRKGKVIDWKELEEEAEAFKKEKEKQRSQYAGYFIGEGAKQFSSDFQEKSMKAHEYLSRLVRRAEEILLLIQNPSKEVIKLEFLNKEGEATKGEEVASKKEGETTEKKDAIQNPMTCKLPLEQIDNLFEHLKEIEAIHPNTDQDNFRRIFSGEDFRERITWTLTRGKRKRPNHKPLRDILELAHNQDKSGKNNYKKWAKQCFQYPDGKEVVLPNRDGSASYDKNLVEIITGKPLAK